MTTTRTVAFAGVAMLAVAGVVASLTGHPQVAQAAVALLAGLACVAALDGQRRAAAASARANQVRDGLEHLRESVAHQVGAAEASARRTSAALDAVRAGVTSLQVEQPGAFLTEVQALAQLHDRYAPSAPLPEVGGWALNPSGLVWLTDEIHRRSPRLVVECGSGTSTVWMAMALREAGGGKVIALEHQELFAERTRAHLERHGLLEFAEVRLAPLVPRETPRGTFHWYDVDAGSLDAIDILVVDGPPKSTGPHARYPALPLLAGRLAPHAAVLVDDVNRAEEREAIALWSEDGHPLTAVSMAGSASEVLIYG